MGKLIGFICLLVFSFCSSQSVKDYLNTPGPLDLNETEFQLDWSKQQSSTLYLQQYLPRDETIENFSQMINISYFDKDINIEDAVRQKVDSFQKRDDKYAKVQVTESPDGTEFIVDGILTENPTNKSEYAEYGIFKFKKTVVDGKASFLIISYIKRNYGDLKSGVKSLQKERNQLMDSVINFVLPPITFSKS